MNVQTTPPHRYWYFLLCYLAYSAYSVDFILRAAIEPQLMVLYHLNAQEITHYYHMVFWGLLIGAILFGCLVDMIGYRACFIWLWIGQTLGLIKLLALSPIITTTSMTHQLKTGMFMMGVAEGGIFVIIHSLIARVFNDSSSQSKTKIMNYLHTNWPLLVIIGVLFEQSLQTHQLHWHFNIYALLVFPFLYLIMALILPLPKQAYRHHIPLMSRIKPTLTPGFILLLCCMVFAITIEQSPKNWIMTIMQSEIHMEGVLFLIFIESIQIIFRLLSGPFALRFSPPGMLCMAAILSAISLYILSFSTSAALGLIAVGLFAMSTAWYWPTFIAIVADRYPLSGGFGIGLMNGSGFFAMLVTIPSIAKLSQAEGVDPAFVVLAWYGVLVFILLAAVSVFFKSQGGYKVFSSSDHSL